MIERTAFYALLSLLLVACGTTAGGDGIDGLTITRTSAPGARGYDRVVCVELVATGAAVTVDVAFEGRYRQVWNDVLVDATGTELCVELCACAAGPVGRFVVTEGEQSFELQEEIWGDFCCESPITADAGT